MNSLQIEYIYDESSIGDREIPNDETIKTLEALGANINFIDIWLKLLRKNYCARSESYSIAMEEMFNQIPQIFGRALTSIVKKSKLMTDIRGGWYMKKSARGIPPFKRTKLSRKAQKMQDVIQKKLYAANRWWNIWKSQLHWNKLEWVDPKYNPKRVKPFSVSSKKFYISKNDRKARFVGNSRLKELDIDGFYKRKQMNEEM